MNTGIGDAVNLSWKLAAALNGASPALLDTYEVERIAFARRLVATTDRAFTVVTKSGRLAAFVRTKVFPVVAGAAFHLAAMRRFLFRIVSQIEIDYRHSRLSEGNAGQVRGGDRLPWVALGGGLVADNFAPLAALRWQVHVYGAARSGIDDVCRELGVVLHQFAWRPEMHGAGFAESAAYLIRPDGYVAAADVGGSGERFRRYVREWAIISRVDTRSS